MHLVFSLILRSKTPFVVTLVTSLLPQLLDYQIVLQGGNGCKGEKLYVCARARAKKLLKRANELWEIMGLDQQKLDEMASIHERLPYK